MNECVAICCQEKCPIGKHCCFGEAYIESLGEKPLRERHKCEYAKSTGKRYVETKTVKPAA